MRRPDRDLPIVAGFFFAALVTRLPFHSHFPYNWDAVGYVLGLERFSIAEQQPMAPGNILYELSGRMSHLIFPDANTALVALSLIGSAAAVAGVYLLGRAMFDRSTAWTAAILLLFSPLLWFYSEVALTYAVAAPIALLCCWLLFRLYAKRRGLVAAAVVVGLAGGFRLDLLMFLGPLWLLGTLRLGRRAMLLSWAVLAASVAAWLAPLLYISGGVSEFLEYSGAQYDIAVRPYTVFTSGAPALVNNLGGLSLAIAWLLGAAIFLLLGAVFLPGSQTRRLSLEATTEGVTVTATETRHSPGRQPALFLIAVILPAVAYFLLFDIANPGYLAVWSGPAALLAAWFIVRMAHAVDRLFKPGSEYGPGTAGGPTGSLGPAGRIFLPAVLAVVAMANTWLFFNTDLLGLRVPFAEAEVRTVFGQYGMSGIDRSDDEMARAADALGAMDGHHSVIVAGTHNDWRKLTYHFADYPVILLDRADGEGYSLGLHHHYTVMPGRHVVIPQEVDTVLFVNMLPASVAGSLVIPGGDPQDLRITGVRLPPEGRLDADGYEIRREDAGAGEWKN